MKKVRRKEPRKAVSQMSKYTTEVRFICETEAGLLESKGYQSIDDILNRATPKVFNFDFPIFDENYRFALEKKILKHYYTREICMETYGAWKLKLDDRMNIIMPYYNELYKSAALEFNPFWDTDLITDHSSVNNGDSSSTSRNVRDNADKVKNNYNDKSKTERDETVNRDTDVTDTKTLNENVAETHNDTRTGTDNNTRWDLYSDTPQGGIQGIANAEDPSLANNGYLTNARKITDNGGDSDTSSGAKNVATTGTDTDRTIGSDDTVVNSEVNVTRNGDTSSDRAQKITDNGNVTGTIHNTEEYLQHIKGKRGGVTYSKMLSEYRKTFLNIDKMIIDELSDLFFGLWE